MAKLGKRLLLVLIMTTVGYLTVTVFARTIPFYTSDAFPIQENILDNTFFSSNQFTQADDLTAVDNFLDVPSGYQLVGETASYQLYMEETSYAIRVVNKEDGFIYGSSMGSLGEDLDNFNTKWEGIVNSVVTLDYYSYNDTTGVYTTEQESLLQDETSHSDYTMIENGFSANLYFGESGISLSIDVYLEGDYLVVDIPNESISEGDTFKLKSVMVYPFLGAVYGDSVPGYIMVPDGSGALIRYQAIDVNTDIYQFKYYGLDTSVQIPITNQPILAFPVSGMVLGINQHGFISIVESGAENASLVVSPAKRNLKYYYTYNQFVYRSLYQTPLSESEAENSSGRLVIEDNINSCDVRMKYQFLAGDEANYIGMANAYQDYLLASNLVQDQVNSTDNVHIFLDVIGSESKNGFIFDEYIKMTTIPELQQIIESLVSKGIQPMTVYKGYTGDGFTSSGMSDTSVSNKLGGEAALNELMDYLDSVGLELYLYTDPMSVYEDGHFSLYNDIARRVNQNLLMEYGYTKLIYYATTESLIRSLDTSIDKLSKQNVLHFAVGTVGNTLYSDYTDAANPLDRSEIRSILIDYFNTLDQSTLLYQSNDYLLRYTDSYLMTPMSSSRYRIYTDTVPFVPYVLSGVLEKYSPYQNFVSASNVELLKLIDYGVYPTYLITYESAYALQKTELQSIYSSSYTTWQTRIESDFLFLQEGLESIVDARVVNRIVEDLGVYTITYDNGVKIIINYTSNTVAVGSNNIEPQSYKVVV
ncbi:MAG: hypothetical protein JXB08_03325 [Bacilli bacterium]|nr:hypothetical protein [Bacilli bacterium]MBN2876321.1 hypothetical protein [Bacilli bacterium]